MSVKNKNLIIDLLFVLVLVAGAYLRLTGMNWDEDQHLHPDERFLTGVEASLAPVSSLGEFFDTANSSLNPNNRGSGFFVYGTLPIFVVRYAAEWVGDTGYDQIQIVGRAISAVADLGVVLLCYLIAAKLFDRRVALFAALFSALSVKQIQEAHFFTVDNFTSLTTYLAIFFAIRIAMGGRPRKVDAEGQEIARPVFNAWDFLGFGLALGMTVASKVSSVISLLPLPALLPLAVAIRLSGVDTAARERSWGRGLLYMLGAALLSLLAFRIFQPYAFSGPGFISGLNPQWVETLKQLQGQVSGNVDWPPSMQWARRPVWFGLQNMLLFGMGLPLGLAALAGFSWAGWRLLKGAWQQPYALLWLWAAGFFVWVSISFNPTMRYFLPVYPAFAIFGAWGLVTLWDSPRRKTWTRPLAGALAAIVVVATALWAVAFVQIYHQPVSRLAATRWIFQNLPGPITLHIQTDEGDYQQPLAFPYNAMLQAETPYTFGFAPKVDGQIESIALAHVLAPVQLSLSRSPDEQVLAVQHQVVDLLGAHVGESLVADFALPTVIYENPGSEYTLSLNFPPGEGELRVENVELRTDQPGELLPQTLLDEPEVVALGESFTVSFTGLQDPLANQVHILLGVVSPLRLDPVAVRLAVSGSEDGAQVMAEAEATVQPGTAKGGLVEQTVFLLDQPVAVSEDQVLFLRFDPLPSGYLSLLGTAVANESSWDDGLPRRMDGYDAFGGIYQGDLNFELYWDEDATKLERFLNILDEAEYIFVSSSRQWASLPRIPERFPLTSAYYRALLGCPDGHSIEWCYNTAELGSFEGQLGYELVEIFTNSPRLGSWEINDQAVEEAFTVYDHPKVFIFKKSADYDSAAVAGLLSSVDLSNVQHITPKEASGKIPPNLILPADRLAGQRAGGTWASIFNTDGWVNAAPWVSAVVWYLALGVLGIAVYPLVRLAMPGLKDGGYPFARLAGMLLLAYLAWLGGSLGLSFSRGWLAIWALLLAALGALAARPQMDVMQQEWREHRGRFLRVEMLFLAFFLIMLLIRLGNPDLWHPSFGGEKPMDFAYFNAVLRSTTFPPYDPWFAGGYINYYYFGFVLVGAFTKLLGILPAVAYNLFLPSLFAMLALGAYSLAWNWFSAWREGQPEENNGISPNLAGLAAAAAMVLLGNLGSLQMILQGYVRLGSAGAALEGAGLLTRWGWGLKGLVANLLGEGLPYGLGQWYWNPTRIIPAASGESGPISEFPLFTFIYADPHAHMFALPLTLLALAWALSVILGRAWEGRRSFWPVAWSFVFAGIVIGSLRPVNTWDLPTYLAISALAVGYAILRYGPRRQGEDGRVGRPWLLAIGGVALLALLSVLSFQPYADWYRQGYTSVQLWTGSRTPSSAYLAHWGIFLFFIVTWMAWETRQWLAATPLSSLRKLQPYTVWIALSALTAISIILGIQIAGIYVVWLALPLMLWAGLLLLRQGQHEGKRLVLFLVGTGLFLSLMVEIIVLRGDISRMNTVFKFYMQIWVLFGVSAALALAWILTELRGWLLGWRGAWQLGAVALLACGALFLFLGGSAKMRDRFAPEAPHTLDGLSYMDHAIYYDKDTPLVLAQDRAAIRWLQENVEGSPTIVEAHTGEYKWGSRISINTGLPAVIGWNWHQRQQREFVPGNDVWGRVHEVEQFYVTEDTAWVEEFLNRYQVRYIVVGQLERAYFPGAGLDKFEGQDGRLWTEVFRLGDTVIYEVNATVLAAQ